LLLRTTTFALITALPIPVLMMPVSLVPMATLALAAARILTLRRRGRSGAPRSRTLTARLAAWPAILSVAPTRTPDLDHRHFCCRGFGFTVGGRIDARFRCVGDVGFGRFGLGGRRGVGRSGRLRFGGRNGLRRRTYLRLRDRIRTVVCGGNHIRSFGRSLSGGCGRLRCRLDRFRHAFR
jgi:hypothetical protein